MQGFSARSVRLTAMATRLLAGVHVARPGNQSLLIVAIACDLMERRHERPRYPNAAAYGTR